MIRPDDLSVAADSLAANGTPDGPAGAVVHAAEALSDSFAAADSLVHTAAALPDAFPTSFPQVEPLSAAERALTLGGWLSDWTARTAQGVASLTDASAAELFGAASTLGDVGHAVAETAAPLSGSVVYQAVALLLAASYLLLLYTNYSEVRMLAGSFGFDRNAGPADVAEARRDPQPFPAPLLRTRRRGDRRADRTPMRRLAAGGYVRPPSSALAGGPLRGGRAGGRGRRPDADDRIVVHRTGDAHAVVRRDASLCQTVPFRAGEPLGPAVHFALCTLSNRFRIRLVMRDSRVVCDDYIAISQRDSFVVCRKKYFEFALDFVPLHHRNRTGGICGAHVGKTQLRMSVTKVSRILVSQPQPAIPEKSPFFELARRQRITVDYHPFIRVAGVSLKGSGSSGSRYWIIRP